MAEENKSIQTPQYYPTVNPGYKMSVGANGQGTVFDTNGNIFHFTSPDDALQSALQEANYQGNVELTADNRTMIAAGKDLLSTPFFKLNILGSINYETSDEELESNNFINIPPSNDPEVTYKKTGDIWEFKFNEQNRGISGFNLTGQSATGQDAIHQLSNVAANVVGSDLKQLFNNSKFYKVDMTGIKMEYGKDNNNKTYYYITIPLIAVKDDKSAYVNFEHKGSWSTNKRNDKTARQNALSNVYGDTLFDKSSTNGGPLDTWNFPVTNVNSAGTNKGWPFFNTIKQNFPTYEYVEKSTGTDNNIYEFWFQWFDPSTIGKLTLPTVTTTQVGEEDDTLDIEGQIFESIPLNENEKPVGQNLGKAYSDKDEVPLTQQEINDITFEIKAIQAKIDNGTYSTFNNAVLGEAAKTADGQLYLDWIAFQMKLEGAGGVADKHDSGGLTTWGVTIGHWKKYAPKVFPGKYNGTAEELISLATQKGQEVLIPYIKITDWDSLGNATSKAPDLYKVMAYKWKFGGVPKASWVSKTAADNFYKDTGGNPITAFWEFWAWRRRCRNKDNELNYLFFGIGWHRGVGVCWLVKDPRKKINGKPNPDFGKPFSKPTCFKIVGTGRSKNSLYNWALNKGYFKPFHEYEIDDSDKKNYIGTNKEFVEFSAGTMSVNGISYKFRTD